MTEPWIISFVVVSFRQVTLFVLKTDNESEEALQIVVWQERMHEAEGVWSLTELEYNGRNISYIRFQSFSISLCMANEIIQP